MANPPTKTTTAPHAPRLSFLLSSIPSRLLVDCAILAVALASSGAAGLINQVVWQRSLKVFLGGSETICSMIVVLVFMAGLGVGSIWGGRQSAQLKDPLRALGLVELALFFVNLGVRGITRTRLVDSIFPIQVLAVSIGVPLVVLYAVFAFITLVIPCFLMGTTMPLAAESCQRRFGFVDTRLLGLLFFVNTLGGVVGAVLASGYMVPHLGQAQALLLAAGGNLVSGILILMLVRSRAYVLAAIPDSRLSKRPSTKSHVNRSPADAIIVFGLGFCSLGFEMYLFRLIPLRHQPLPFSFAAILVGFLSFWCIGSALSSRPRLTISNALRLCAISCGVTIPVFVFDSPRAMLDSWSMVSFILWRFPYFLPCLFFGYLFSGVISRAARSWGSDVGRLYALNTLGSCLGILSMTLVGYEVPFYSMILVIALCLYALQEYEEARQSDPVETRGIPRWVYPLSAGFVAIVVSLVCDLSGVIPSMRLFFGRNGIVGIDAKGNLMWDGLWHSSLSIDNNHIGTNNWYVGVCPVVSHSSGEIRDVCVIGLAAGITASTLAKLDSVERIDAYDINPKLTAIFHRYPAGTLHIADNSKIHFIWQDARSGLALNKQKYDIIQAEPLYLKQAGSGLLNSVEFYRLVSERLRPGGIFCLYSNGTPEQAFAVRQTASRVFPHRESFFHGYLLVLSNDPIEISEEALSKNLATDDLLWREIHSFGETRDAPSILRLVDRPRLPWGDGRLIVTDDHPIVEYPSYLSDQVRRLGYDLSLPSPGIIP